MPRKKSDNQRKTLIFTLLISIALGLSLLVIKTRVFPEIPGIFLIEPKPHQPQNIKITNLSDNSFSISWVTQKLIQKSAITFYQKNEKPKTIKVPETSPTKIHQVDIHNLTPQTTYYFTIFSEKETFLNNDKSFEVKTLKITEKPPDPPFIITGSVKDRDGNPQPNVLVFFGLNNDITPLSAWTNEKGNFLLTLNNARNKKDGNYFSPQQGQIAHLMVETGEVSYTKKIAIEKGLDLIISPTMEAKTTELPNEKRSRIVSRKSLWERIKNTIRVILER